MIQPLPLRLRPIPGEPSHGTFLRLSARNGARSPKHFASALGLSVRAVLAGHHREEIEAWAGLPPGVLAPFSAHPSHITRIVDLGNEKVDLGDWSLRQRRVCPLCIAEDCHNAQSNDLPNEAAIHHRAYWDVQSISSCHKHHAPLLFECQQCRRPLSWTDPAIGKCGGGCNLTTATPTNPREELDRYLASRLGFGTASKRPQLDGFEYRHAVRFCELLGHLKLQEWSEKLPRRSPAECAAARSHGFSISNDLDQNLWPLLDKVLACSRAKSRSSGIIAAYGWVYSQWVSEDLPVAQPIRSILRAHAVANGVIAPQEPILGFKASPTLSIQQMRSVLRSGHNSTRRRLSAAGHIPQATRRGVKCAIDPRAIQAIQELPTATGLGTRLIGKRLGVGRGCARELLVLGLLDDCQNGRTEQAVDDFAFVLIAKCGAFPPSDAKCVKEAAKSRNIRLADILSAIAAGQLSAWLMPESSNLSLAQRLMVVPSQVQVRNDESIPITKAAKLLSLHPEAVGQLVKVGFLSRTNGRGLSAESIATFNQRFAALAPLAYVHRTTSRALARDLESHGIEPVFAPPQFRQILYRRRDLAAHGKISISAGENG